MVLSVNVFSNNVDTTVLVCFMEHPKPMNQ